MATRKKPRTAAQKRATKKLVAFNKARGRLNKKRAKAKPAKRKTRSVTLKRKRARATGGRRVRRATPTHIIVAKVKMGGSIRTRYWDGQKGFDTSKAKAKKYLSQGAAKRAADNMLPRLPGAITHLEIREI